MKQKFSDGDILKLLSSLKDSENGYPSGMIQSRRDMYVKQAAAMAVLADAGGNGAITTKNGQTTASSSAGNSFSVGTLLETALIAALVIEAGVAAYIYQDKITDFINSTLSPKIEVVASPPGSSSSEILATEDTSTATPVATVTITVTAAETPTPVVTILPAAGSGDVNNNDDNTNSDSGGDVQITSTPNPNENPGLHLGQTKQPTRDPNTDKKNDTDGSSNKDKNKDSTDKSDKGNKK